MRVGPEPLGGGSGDVLRDLYESLEPPGERSAIDRVLFDQIVGPRLRAFAIERLLAVELKVCNCAWSSLPCPAVVVHAEITRLRAERKP